MGAQNHESIMHSEGDLPPGDAQCQTVESVPCTLPPEDEQKESQASDRWATMLLCLVFFSDYKSSLSWVSAGFALHRKRILNTNGLHQKTNKQLEEMRNVQAKTKAIEQQIAQIEGELRLAEGGNTAYAHISATD